jgi:hypothetical protein
MTGSQRTSRGAGAAVVLGGLVVLGLLGALYFWAVLSWSYSEGERAGWIQKFSRKGWLCKTWEGEIALVSLPGAMPEKFFFTVRDEDTAAQINKSMGKRVSLHYEEKVGLPTSCFGETRYYVTHVTHVDDMRIDAPAPAVATPPAAPAAK